MVSDSTDEKHHVFRYVFHNVFLNIKIHYNHEKHDVIHEFKKPPL